VAKGAGKKFFELRIARSEEIGLLVQSLRWKGYRLNSEVRFGAAPAEARASEQVDLAGGTSASHAITLLRSFAFGVDAQAADLIGRAACAMRPFPPRPNGVDPGIPVAALRRLQACCA
jgi:hypothetical protein